MFQWTDTSQYLAKLPGGGVGLFPNPGVDPVLEITPDGYQAVLGSVLWLRPDTEDFRSSIYFGMPPSRDGLVQGAATAVFEYDYIRNLFEFSGARLWCRSGLQIESLSGLLKGVAGVVVPAVASTDYVVPADLSSYSLADHDHSGVYEPVISAGSAGQYWSYNKTWQTLNQAAVAGLTTADTPVFDMLKLGGANNWIFERNDDNLHIYYYPSEIGGIRLYENGDVTISYEGRTTTVAGIFAVENLIPLDYVKMNDMRRIYFGTGSDANIHYTGTNWSFEVGQPTTAIMFNSLGYDVDFIIKGDNDANLFTLDAALDRIGIGKTGPNEKLDVNGNVRATGYLSSDGTAGVTAGIAVAKVGGGTRTLSFKNGLYIAYTDS